MHILELYGLWPTVPAALYSCSKFYYVARHSVWPEVSILNTLRKTCHTALIQMSFLYLILSFQKMAETNYAGGHRKRELVQGNFIFWNKIIECPGELSFCCVWPVKPFFQSWFSLRYMPPTYFWVSHSFLEMKGMEIQSMDECWNRNEMKCQPHQKGNSHSCTILHKFAQSCTILHSLA